MRSDKQCPTTSPTRKPTPRRRWVLWVFPVIGLLSLIWFLLRVIPKPTRAGYPCQRVAAPLASSFVLWVAGVFGSILAFHKAKRLLRRSRAALAVLCIAIGVIGVWVAVTNMQERSALADAPFVPSDAPLSPMGVARGIHPGRVAWVRDTAATSWGGSGYWWDDAYNDQTVIDNMMSNAIRWLTGETTDVAAWDAVFKYHNGGTGYAAGEKIAIKINEVNAYNQTGNTNKNIASPHVVLALVSQLIDNAGVAPGDITVYDASRYLAACVYNKLDPLGVVCAQRDPGAGRIGSVHDNTKPIYFSNDQVAETMVLKLGDYNGPFYLPTYHTAAKYFINLANMKAHDLVGVTLCGKNIVGSLYNTDVTAWDQGWGPGSYGGLHQYFRTMKITSSWPQYPARPYATYNSLVDLLGHDEFAGKAILYMFDALYVSKNHSDVPNKWESLGDPNDWVSSIFVSQDPLAIDSVGLDFLRNEETVKVVQGDVDNYLHEAAQADAPPSGTFYDPNHAGDVARLSPLGVHEHWNNATDRKYTRNLGIGLGIELISSAPSPPVGRYVFYNNSAFDGSDPAAGAADDNAIAPDKEALLPGGAGGLANYTSYWRGINGVMVDIANLPGTPTAADFIFKVGNDSNPAAWATAPSPSSITVRAGEGTGGSDRITIIWADNAIEKQWLSVAVLATANTGLSTADTFYFGNAIGETGNSPTDAEVTPADQIAVRNNPHTLGDNPAGITDTCDFDRNQKVGPADAITCRNNGTSGPTALQLIYLP